MRGLYRFILGFYPAEYRIAFGAEMIDVFDQARADMIKRGLPKLAGFLVSELGGLTKGLLSEHAAKWRDGAAYITSRCAARHHSDLPAEIVEVQQQLEHLIRSMEFAIAHHDFLKARFYSNEEYATRTRLQRLMGEYGGARP